MSILRLKSTKQVVSLQFPPYDFRLRQSDRGHEIWDQWRRKWILLTPEEWVRQHLGRFLVETKMFPAGRLALEQTILFNGMRRRTDMVAYSATGSPLFLAECKAPEVTLSQTVIDQIATYNTVLRVPYLMITNGLQHFCGHLIAEEARWEWLSDIPEYSLLR